METTFSGIRITIEATDPKAAYGKLCEILDVGCKAGILEYETCDFCTDDDPDNDRDTSELWETEAETTHDERETNP